jgi:hypothetical protein
VFFWILDVGTAVWYLFHVAPIENEENVVVLFLVTVRDISEFKDPIVENGEVFESSSYRKQSRINAVSGFCIS